MDKKSIVKDVIIILGILAVCVISSTVITPRKLSKPITPYNTTKPYNENCVVCEVSWIKDKEEVIQGIKPMYEKLGYQPYIVVLAYQDKDFNEIAETYFKNNITDENAVAYIYMADQRVEQSRGQGKIIIGEQVDKQIPKLLADYIDSVWYSNKSTEDMLIKSFTETTNLALGVDNNSSARYTIFGIIVVFAIVFTITLFKKRW